MPPAPTGREVELAAVAAQSPGALEKVEPKLPAPYVPPDPETIGVTRRQFFNRSIVALTSAGLAGFGAAVVGFLWSAPKGGFGGKISVGSLDDINAGIAQNSGFYYVPEARAWITAYPAEALPQAEAVYAAPGAGRHAGGHQRALPEVPASRLPCARSAPARSGSSAPATAVSTTGRVRRRPGRRRGAWTASASTSAAAASRSTRA